MKAKIQSKVLQDALSLASKIAPPIEENVTFVHRGGKCYLISLSELSRAEVVLPLEIKSKDFEFAVPIEALRAATKGRDELEMEWDGNLLNLVGASYSTSLLTVDALARDSLDKVDSTEVSLSIEQVAVLKTLVSEVALRPTALLSSFIPVTVKLSAKGTFVACYDNQHMAFTQSKELQGDGMVTLPLDKLQTILDAFNGASVKLSISSSRVDIRSKRASASLNLPSMDDSISAEDVIGKAREVAKTEGDLMTLPKDEAILFADNARAVIGKERVEVKATPTKGGVGFSVKTVRGTVKALLKTSSKCKTPFVLDFEYFDELLRKTKGSELLLSVVADSYVASNYEGGTILVSMNQG